MKNSRIPKWLIPVGLLAMAFLGFYVFPKLASGQSVDIVRDSAARYSCVGSDGTVISENHTGIEVPTENCANAALAAPGATFEVVGVTRTRITATAAASCPEVPECPACPECPVLPECAAGEELQCVVVEVPPEPCPYDGTLTADDPACVPPVEPTGPQIVFRADGSNLAVNEPLDGATVAGSLWVYTWPETETDEVNFYLDGTFERREGSPPYCLGPSPCAYNFEQLPAGQHTVRAEGINYDGSTWASQATFDVTAPVATALSWTAPTENADGTSLDDLAGYRIYRAGALVGTTTDTTFTYQGTGCFTVRAYDTGGLESADSNQACK